MKHLNQVNILKRYQVSWLDMIWDVFIVYRGGEVTQQEQAGTRQRMDNGGRRHVVMVWVGAGCWWCPPPALYCTSATALLDMHEILSLFILSKQKASSLVSKFRYLPSRVYFQ